MQKLDPPWLEDRLRKIAALLIEAHRNGNHELIARYALRVPDMEKGSPKRQFMRLIQVFHPDRLVVYVRQVSDCRSAGNEKGLAALEALLEYESAEGAVSQRRRQTRPESRDDRADRTGDYGFTETYGFGEDDFGYGEETSDDVYETYESGDYEEEDPFEEGSFMDAIKREFFGNLDLWPTEHEISQFEGELDLSDYDLRDLSGAEYCVNVSSLNLAMNRIDNVWPLRDLTSLEFLDLSSNNLEVADDLGELCGLKELDLSFNEIDDVSFLLRLPLLACVSLIGNPVKDLGVLEELRKRGVAVIM